MSHFSYRETWVEISLDAIYENTQTFKKNLLQTTTLMAVVKADGYGHGAIEISKTALKAGATYLGVALLDEAIVLRKAGITAPILVLGYIPPDCIEAAIDQNITITVYTSEVLTKIISISDQKNKNAAVHIKVDTGMGRIGVTTKEDALLLATQATLAPSVHLEGIFTHFASADSDNHDYTYQQFKRFTETINYLEVNHIFVPIKHCCNSAATINFTSMHLDMVRVGISLYGLRPSNEVESPAFPLKQAMQFKTKVSALKQLSAAETVSYGCTFKADRETTIATLPVGYADGLSRLLSNKGHVLINNQRVPIVGRICMDQTMVSISPSVKIDIGTEVIFFGGSKNNFITIDEVAEQMGTINYEVVCLISKRVPRVYTKNNQIINYQNLLLDNHFHLAQSII